MLKGFLFELHNTPGHMAAELNQTTDGRMTILCNCNGAVSEADITGCEGEFVERLYSCHIEELERFYDAFFEIMCYPPRRPFKFRLECSFDGNYVISSGIDVLPNEIAKLVPYLRRKGLSIPLAKGKEKRISDHR